MKKLRHFITIENFSRSEIEFILNKAEHYCHLQQPSTLLANKTIANLFFETSTRTRCSFEIAGKRLGAHVINLDVSTSSTQKGESLIDTVNTLAAMGCDLFVIRHNESGIMDYIIEHLQGDAGIINAGDGTNAHPTQAMLDILTIRQHKKDFTCLSVAIVGDIKHSRVARSALLALKILGVPDIRLIGPEALLPSHLKAEGITLTQNLMEGVKDCDVIMSLRIQKERMKQAFIPDENEFFRQYGLTKKHLEFAKPDAIIMHPGPINRGIEIASDLADCPQSVILQQVKNGVAVRMALLDLLLQ